LFPTAAFAAFHFQLFAFPYAFQFEQGDQHSPSQTSAGQYSSETNQLLSLSPEFNLFSYNIFSFEPGRSANAKLKSSEVSDEEADGGR